MKLSEIAEEIRIQDNLITSNPIFILFERKWIPTKEDWGESYYYLDSFADYTEIDGNKEALKKHLEYHGEEIPDNFDDMTEYELDEWIENKEGYEKIYYIEVNEYRQSFFTKKSLEKHLKNNNYHYKRPFIYCSSMWRNPEMELIRKSLIENKFIDG